MELESSKKIKSRTEERDTMEQNFLINDELIEGDNHSPIPGVEAFRYRHILFKQLCSI